MSTTNVAAGSVPTTVPVVVPCTLDTCPLSAGMVTYQPSIGGNAFFAAFFGVIFFAQLYIAIRHKTWTYLVAMVFGLLLEVVGYVGRLLLNSNPFDFNYFLVYLICLTIAPAFLTAAIYITFSRIIYCCDESLSMIRPKTISIIFMTFDFICLVLQAAGGAITATTGGLTPAAKALRQTGVNVMIAGLSFQVVSLFLFILYAAIYAWRWHAATALRYRRQAQSPHSSLRWRTLVFGLTIASVTIFIRCVFRVAELKDGFSSHLANDEVAFMILESTMVLIACLCMTIGHPGLCLDIPWKLPKHGSKSLQDTTSDVDLEIVTNRK